MKKNQSTPQTSFENMPQVVAQCYEELTIVKKFLLEIKENFEPKSPTEYLTRTQVKEMFKCDISTVHNWTVAGKLKAYGLGNRVYYKRSEVESALTPLN